MTKKGKKSKERLDKFYHLAKEYGFRSRAAFKLIQLNKKFGFLEKANVLIDLCAAPGSWSQVASKCMPVDKTIIAVDLDPIRPIPNALTITNDIKTLPCLHEIKRALKNNKADVVLNDGAPNVGVTWIQDAFSQAELVLASCKLATDFLVLGGTFVTKVFRSSEYTKLLWVFNQLFSCVTATKPQASRNVSAEIYVICQGYLAPKKIDPKLLDSKFVLMPVHANAPKSTTTMNIFRKGKDYTRIGYDDDINTLMKKSSVSSFILSEDPIGILSRNHVLEFQPECEIFFNHHLTNDEVKNAFKDIKALSKKDFRMLIKWRNKMTQHYELVQKENQDGLSSTADEEIEEPTLTKKEEEAELFKEMDEESRRIMRYEHKLRRKHILDKKKQRMRLAMSLDTNDEMGVETEGYDPLFSLKEVKVKLDLNANPDFIPPDISSTLGPDYEDNTEESENESDLSDDEIERRKVSKIETKLDLMYTNYLLNSKSSSKLEVKMLRQKTVEDFVSLKQDSHQDAMAQQEFNSLVETKAESYLDGDGDDVSKLIYKDPESDLTTTSNIWYSQDILQEVMEDEDEDDKIEIYRRMGQISMLKEKTQQLQKASDLDVSTKRNTHTSESINASNYEPSVSKRFKIDKSATENENLDHSHDFDPTQSSGNDNHIGPQDAFEQVESDGENYLDSEDDGYNSDDKAEIMALAKKLQDPSQRRELAALAYSRRQFSDYDSLPIWFKDQEQIYNKPNPPITKIEFQEMKTQLKAINARCTKRVAEAQARRKKRLTRRLDKANSKVMSIMHQEDVPENVKAREMERVFKKAKISRKPSKVYVFADGKNIDHTRGGIGQKRSRHVDLRLKKDKRAKAAKSKRKSK